jgi:DnaJ like chaperone protein
MAKYEKWLGAGLGWVVTGSPLGGLLGFVAGKTMESDNKEYSNTANTSEFETNLLVIAASVIKADGRVSIDEINFVRDFFIDHFSADHIDEKMRILNHCISRGYDPRKACDEIRLSSTAATRTQIIHFLFEIAISDKALDKSETELIFKLAGWLNVNDIEFKSIKASYSIENQTKYTLLGVQSTATAEEIKAAYRKLVLEYHPDRNTDLSPAEQAKAADKFRRIQEAFEKIKAERGIA